MAVAVGGTVLGLAVGAAVRVITGRVDDPIFSVVITFLAPVAAYLPAEELGLSGVLATVTAGIYLGRHAPRNMSSDVRLAGQAAWQILLFLIKDRSSSSSGCSCPRSSQGSKVAARAS